MVYNMTIIALIIIAATLAVIMVRIVIYSYTVETLSANI